MKTRQQAAPQYTTDAEGQQLVHVALANTDQRATLHAEDYQRWLAAGFSRHWSLTNTGGRFLYVLAHARSPSSSQRSLTVARWIAGAGKGQRVGYADGDRLNLCRENLALVQGPAKAAAAWLRPNDGTPLRRPAKAQPPVAHAAPARPARPAVTQQAPAAPVRPVRPAVIPQAPAAPAAEYTPRVVDLAALGQRVREQLKASAATRGGAL